MTWIRSGKKNGSANFVEMDSKK